MQTAHYGVWDVRRKITEKSETCFVIGKNSQKYGYHMV